MRGGGANRPGRRDRARRWSPERDASRREGRAVGRGPQDRGARGRAAHPGRRAYGRTFLVRRPARPAARQDAGRGRGRRRDEERHRLHLDHAAQGYLAPHDIPGVGRGRRVRQPRVGRRGRHDDAARPLDLSRAAVGAAQRLDAVRHRLRRRPADAAQHAAGLSPLAHDPEGGGLRVLRRSRGRVPSVQAGEGASRPGRRGATRPAGTVARSLAAQPGLPVLDRVPLRRARSDPRDPACQHRRPCAAVALARNRVRAEPGRIHLPRGDGPASGRCHGAVPQRHQAGRATQRLSRDFHVPAQAAQRHVERLASASVAQGQERRQCLRRSEGAAVGSRHALDGRPARAISRTVSASRRRTPTSTWRRRS